MLLLPPVALAMIILNLKKKFNHKGNKKWAFFHPFWYCTGYIVMMEEVVKKYFGVSSKNSLPKQMTKLLSIA